jgi:hypothetical protein
VSLRGDKRQMVAAGLFAVSIVALLVAATGCGGATTTTLPIPNVTVNPADFSTTIDNQYMPLRPGTKLIYEGTKDGAATRIEVSITKETRLIMGVTCVVVNDQVLVKGQLEEATLDWYAQDSKGNVWYFGEDSKEYQNGKVLSTKGSWEAGVEGAQPGSSWRPNRRWATPTGRSTSRVKPRTWPKSWPSTSTGMSQGNRTSTC